MAETVKTLNMNEEAETMLDGNKINEFLDLYLHTKDEQNLEPLLVFASNYGNTESIDFSNIKQIKLYIFARHIMFVLSSILQNRFFKEKGYDFSLYLKNLQSVSSSIKLCIMNYSPETADIDTQNNIKNALKKLNISKFDNYFFPNGELRSFFLKSVFEKKIDIANEINQCDDATAFFSELGNTNFEFTEEEKNMTSNEIFGKLNKCKNEEQKEKLYAMAHINHQKNLLKSLEEGL
jgi:hypothetical protein